MTAIIWTKTTCPSCIQAKKLMTNYGIDYEERVLGENWSPDQLFEQCDAEGIDRPRSAPQIWMHGKYVGGFEDLKTHIEQTFTGSTEGKF